MKKILGAAMVSSPFVALFIYNGTQFGWLHAVALFASIFGAVAFLALGVYLIAGNDA